MGFRRFKAEILDLLREVGFRPTHLDRSTASPSQKINPLFSFLYHGDALVRWRAIASLGHVVYQMAAVEMDMEGARVVMRRLMWNLNDESGGMGWGSPEAMAEIMACHAHLADEFAGILVSYLNPEGNFLEHPGLQSGVLWGLGRLGRIQADRVVDAAPFVLPFLSHTDDTLRGLAAWAGVILGSPLLRPGLHSLATDSAGFQLFFNDELKDVSIAQVLSEA
jgi:hypothetical protein